MIATQWLLEDTVIYVEVAGDITVEDAATLNRELMQYLKGQQPKSMHIVFDATQVRSVPNAIAVLHVSFLRHPAFACAIIVGPRNGPMQGVVLKIMRIVGVDLFYDTDADTVFDEFQSMNPTVPDLYPLYLQVHSAKHLFAPSQDDRNYDDHHLG
jgi:hypothetical protein